MASFTKSDKIRIRYDISKKKYTFSALDIAEVLGLKDSSFSIFNLLRLCKQKSPFSGTGDAGLTYITADDAMDLCLLKNTVNAYELSMWIVDLSNIKCAR